MTAAARLPLLRQAQVRVAVAGIDTEVRRIASRIGALSLVDEGERPSATIDALERLLQIVHDAADEADALRALAEHLLQTLQRLLGHDPIGRNRDGRSPPPDARGRPIRQ